MTEERLEGAKQLEAIMANRLREWVHEKYGKWITHATALRAMRYIFRGETK